MNAFVCGKKKVRVTMLLDTKGQKGGALYSRRNYCINEKYAKKLIEEGRAVLYEPMKFVTVHTAEGENITMSWGEYLKRKKG